jgi:hypothetical protein
MLLKYSDLSSKIRATFADYLSYVIYGLERVLFLGSLIAMSFVLFLSYAFGNQRYSDIEGRGAFCAEGTHFVFSK